PLFRSQHVHARAQPVADLVRRADGAHQPRPRVLRDAGPAGRISGGGLCERPAAGAGSVTMADLKIWMNGKVVPGEQAVLPVNSAAVFYATNCFEGLRAYWNAADGEMYGFRLAEHFARLRESMKMMRFTVPYSDVDLYEAVREVLKANEIREDVHMHMVAYVLGTGLDATTPTGLYINPRRRPSAPTGLRACVSWWTRAHDNGNPIRLKSGYKLRNG